MWFKKNITYMIHKPMLICYNDDDDDDNHDIYDNDSGNKEGDT